MITMATIERNNNHAAIYIACPKDHKRYHTAVCAARCKIKGTCEAYQRAITADGLNKIWCTKDHKLYPIEACKTRCHIGGKCKAYHDASKINQPAIVEQ